MSTADETRLSRLDWIVLVWAVLIYAWFKVCCAYGYGVAW